MSKISLGPEDKKSIKNFKTPIIAGVSTLLVLCLVFVMVKVNSSINKDDTKALNNSSAVEAMAGVNSGSGKDKNNGKEDNKSVNSGSSKDNKGDDKNDDKSDDSGSDIKNTKQQDLIKAQEIINRSKKSKENPISDENEIIDNIEDFFVDDDEAVEKVTDDLLEEAPEAINNFSLYLNKVQTFFSLKDDDWFIGRCYNYYSNIYNDASKATEELNNSFITTLNDDENLEDIKGVYYSSYYIMQSFRDPENNPIFGIIENLESKSSKDLNFLNLDGGLSSYMNTIPGFDILVFLGNKYDLSTICNNNFQFSSKLYISNDMWGHNYFNGWDICSYLIPFKDLNNGYMGFLGFDKNDNFMSLYIV